MDNACREYLFIMDFFVLHDRAATDFFLEIFDRTFKLIQRAVEASMNECYDPIAILLSLHLVYRYQVITNKRNVPIMNKFESFFLGFLSF